MSIIRVGIIGQGRSGRDIHGTHLATLPGKFRIVAVADALEDRRQRAETEYGCESCATPAKLLARDDIDLVVNASPSRFHVPLTLAALKAGQKISVAVDGVNGAEGRIRISVRLKPAK